MIALDSATENVSSMKFLSIFSTYLLNSSLASDETLCMLEISCCNLLFSWMLESWISLDASETYCIILKCQE